MTLGEFFKGQTKSEIKIQEFTEIAQENPPMGTHPLIFILEGTPLEWST